MSTTTMRERARRIVTTSLRQLQPAPQIICAACGQLKPQSDILANHCHACADAAIRQARKEIEACKR